MEVIESGRLLPEHCIEGYFAKGEACFDGKKTKFDVLWTWVNGSDPYFRKAKKEGTKEVPQRNAATVKMFRCVSLLSESLSVTNEP
jgi:hypothetical protein